MRHGARMLDDGNRLLGLRLRKSLVQRRDMRINLTFICWRCRHRRC